MKNEDQSTLFERLANDLKGPFDFSIDRKPETLYFRMQTEFAHMGFDGKRTATETYVLLLSCVPAAVSGEALDRYRCGGLSVQFDTKAPVTIPSLEDWEYELDPMSGADGMGPVFGVPHDVFEGLADENGDEFSPEIRYLIYNNFIDFHALNDVFSRPLFGQGIERLKHVGDRMVHPAAHTEAPVNLGTTVRPGSVYRNGEVALDFKGISLVDGAVCAMIGYDSGESTLKMQLASKDGVDVSTEGGSEYKGDIYIDVETGWVRKVTLDEYVESRTGPVTEAARDNQCAIRHLLLRLISQKEYEDGPVSSP